MNPELESRICSLERQVKHQRWIGSVAGLCLIAVFTIGAVEDTDKLHDVLKAKNVIVTDGEGKDSALISKSGILFFNDKARPMALYSNIGFTLYGRDGGVIATVSRSEDGEGGSITLRNKAGKMVGTGGDE